MAIYSWLRRQFADHPVRTVAVAGILFTLVLCNLKLFAAGGPWWRGWADQKAYLESARAFAGLDLNPERHWYPLLYPLLAAPFAWIPAPFVPIDLACYAAAFVGFRRVALRFGVGGAAAALLFLATTLAPGIGALWVVPWSTTLSAALIWLLFAAAADFLFESGQGRRHATLFGVLLALVPLARPGDLLIAAAVVPFALWRPLRQRRWLLVLAVFGGAAWTFVGYGLLHLAVYGARWSDYVLLSRDYGVALTDLPWKAYVLLIEPAPWFPGETGLLRAMPWLLAGLAGLILALVRLRGAQRALLACIGLAGLAYCATTIGYRDLLPTGMWRFSNVNYFKWLFPLFGLGALLLVRLGAKDRRLAAALLVGLVLVTGLRPAPRPVSESEPARALVFEAPAASWSDLHWSQSVIVDAGGIQRNPGDYHQIPASDRMIAVALRRDFRGPAEWLGNPPPGIAHWPARSGQPEVRLPGPWPRAPIARYGERIAFGYPCWLPPWPCVQTFAE